MCTYLEVCEVHLIDELFCMVGSCIDVLECLYQALELMCMSRQKDHAQSRHLNESIGATYFEHSLIHAHDIF